MRKRPNETRLHPFGTVALHGVAAADSISAEVRLYDTLFKRPDPGADGDIFADLNPNSRDVLKGYRIEPALVGGNSREAVQSERQGYFCQDPDSTPTKPVFNRTIGLRDTWAKEKAKGG